MTSLTDRYVSATVRGLDEAQRGDVERELRATIEDMVDARLSAGTTSHEEAERAVLVELGDPMRLAAGYSGKPLHLVGPTVFPQWRRLVTLLLWTVVPIVTVLNLVIRLFVDDVAADGVGPAFGSAAGLAVQVAVHVVFWTTLVFAVVERTQPGEVGGWSPDQLPEDDASRQVGLGETVASVVALVLLALALVWQHTSSPVRRGGDVVPVLDPALWSGWIPVLFVLVVAQVAVALAAFRARRWTLRLALLGAALDVAAVAAVLWLLHSDRLFNPGFLAALRDGGWAQAAQQLPVGLTVGIVLITAVDQLDTFRRVRATAT